MKQAISLLVTFVLMISYSAPTLAKQPNGKESMINLSHLDSLNEEITIDGTEMLITHIYSEYPDYDWVDASGEGIAAVDDVARAAIVYLTDYENNKNLASLDKAKKLLNFVMYMQAEDGEFYNFIYEDLSINKNGSTSKKSFDWWAARGMWALGYGYKIFEKVDSDYAQQLEDHFLLGNKALQNEMNDTYGEYDLVHGVQVPRWITGFDAMSNALLGLSEYYSTKPNEDVKDSMLKLGTGLSEYQYGDFDTYPYSAHLGWDGSPTLWHAWGSSQSFALAKAGKVLNKPEWIQSAKNEADNLFTHLLVTGMIKEMAPTPTKDEQIAYGVNMIVQGFMETYKATNDVIYARYAGLAASWFTGNNDANYAMYDPQTGRGYDGINGDTGKVNYNSGAESTIEALFALQAITSNNKANKYLNARTLNRFTKSIIEAETFTTTKGSPEIMKPTSPWTGDALYSDEIVLLEDQEAIKKEVSLEKGEYLVYAAIEKKHSPQHESFLNVQLDGVNVGRVLVSNSTADNYLTLIKVGKTSSLERGKHTLKLSAMGETAVIDNIVLQPVKESVVFSVKKNKSIILERDFQKETIEMNRY
ncbi:hypothetical protein [Pseudalkalibacillus hwajinpoensis]|uniref:Uncharacterized protein n=1 Tax=Guptibacillus hwajinpoensis TaxID=208199 RepID=A0A4U1MLI9_9BACL|nr:hypothetical protein [Pseudalkalibacillus hwajinpoensis]TKD72359.1 hypothetical protein FBF83_06150 [Pseudalkalibacillus hwajinpoensis]